MKGHLNQGHLTEEDLIGSVYRIAGTEAGNHLTACAECRDRLAAFEQRRLEAAQSEDISEAFLQAQRRRIEARLERPSRSFQWMPAAAAAAVLLVAGLFMYHPAGSVSTVPAPKAAVTDQASISDEELFRDVYQIEQAAEPRAAAPIQALFQEQ